MEKATKFARKHWQILLGAAFTLAYFIAFKDHNGFVLGAALTALTATDLTLVDVAKRSKDGVMLPVVEALQQRNGLLQSMVWKQGNTDTGHQVASRNSLPSVSWVRYNDGVLPSKSTVDTFTERTGILEGLSSVDKRVAQINGNEAAFRASEDDAFLAQMANTLESAFFYESTKVNPERIMGLSPRLGLSTAGYGNQIIKAQTAETTADQASIWLIGWGERTVYGITPRGQPTGLEMEDKGEIRDKDSTTGAIKYKYETLFRWRCGLCVEDYRFLVRIANVSTSTLTVDAATGADLIRSMVKAYWQIFDPRAVRLAWYCNRTIGSFLHQQALSKTYNSTLSIDPAPMIGGVGIFGQPIVRALGFPIYISDALTNTETYVN
jgi:hypothetical protein